MLPNVIAEFQAFSLNGHPIIVKNTFVDVAEAAPCEPSHRRCKSVPLTCWAKPSDQIAEQSALGSESLHDVRCRAFTESLDAMGASRCRLEIDSVSIVTSDSCSPLGCSKSRHTDHVDAAEVLSNASTQVPCSSISTRARFYSDLPDASARVPLSLDNLVKDGVTAHPLTTPPQDAGDRTTLMFRNLPVWFTREKLEKLLNAEGFGMLYNFIYLPAELGTGACFGYAFINMATPGDAERFVEYFQGFDRWPETDTRRAVVHLSEALQGLDEQIERYRNSPLMHPSVADELRPAVYWQGVRMPFPEPTAPIKPPRARTSTKKKLPPALSEF
jgi:RNA recognition motif-containing protein